MEAAYSPAQLPVSAADDVQDPSPEVAATQRFIEMQGRLLASYGVQATSRFVEQTKPRMRAHVLEAGEDDAVPVAAR